MIFKEIDKVLLGFDLRYSTIRQLYLPVAVEEINRLSGDYSLGMFFKVSSFYEELSTDASKFVSLWRKYFGEMRIEESAEILIPHYGNFVPNACQQLEMAKKLCEIARKRDFNVELKVMVDTLNSMYLSNDMTIKKYDHKIFQLFLLDESYCNKSDVGINLVLWLYSLR